MKNIKEILFQNNCFGQTAFEEHAMDLMVRTRKTTTVFSKYTVGGMNKSTNVLCSPLAKAVVRYLTDKNCGVGKHGDFFVSSLKTATFDQFCIYNAKLGEIKHLFNCPLIEVDKKTMLYSKYNMVTDRKTTGYGWESNTGEVVWLALLPQLFEDEEIKKQLPILKAALKSPDAQGGFIPQEGEDALFVISDNIYRRIKHAYCTADTPIVTVEIPELGDESLLIKTVDELLSYSPHKVYAGDFKELGIGNKSGTPIYTVEELPKQFSLTNPALLTTEQEERIPKLESWYVIPDYLIQSLIAIKTFHNAESKFQNILLSGRAGSGKSKAAQALAYATNLPFYPINCNPNTDEMQLTGGFSPNVEKGENSVIERPSLEEIELDPETAYRRMTGESREITSEEVLNYLKRSEKNQADFIVTNTPLVEAVRNGGVIELQEISLIKDPGMLGMLNSLMDSEKEFITIPTTGETIVRHPDCIVVATTNVDYAGCRPINTAFKDRFKLHFIVENPSNEVVFERALKKTGFEDEDLLKRVVDAFCEIVKFREDSQEEDSATLRCLYNWLDFYKAMNGNMDIKMCAEPTLISKLSFDKEEREEARNIIEKYL